MADQFEQQYSAETLIELGKLALKLARGKDTRRSFLKDVKKIDPNYTLPGDQQVADLRQELEDKEAERTLKQQQDEIKNRLERQRQGLMDGTLIPGKKFDADSLKEIEEKIMPKYGISDYEGAARIYLGHNATAPQQQKPSGAGTSWTFPDIPGLMDDPTKAAREAAAKVIDELHGRAA